MGARRKCPECGSRRALSQYTLATDQSRAVGYRRSCDPCKRRWQRGHNLKMRYGLTLEDYEEILAAQGGACAACGGDEGDVQTANSAFLYVDHCHTTGKVRGLLCDGCNRAIGFLRDDAHRAWLLIHYLAQTSPTISPSNTN